MSRRKPRSLTIVSIMDLMKAGYSIYQTAAALGIKWTAVRSAVRYYDLPYNRRVEIGGRREMEIVLLSEFSVPPEAIGLYYSMAAPLVTHIINEVKKRSDAHGPLQIRGRRILTTMTGYTFKTKPKTFHQMPEPGVIL